MVAATGWSQVASKNIDLLAHVPYTELTSDVAGYVHNGVEYAVIGHASGVSLMSLANPSAPVILQEIPYNHNIMWHEVDVYQDYAYVVNEASGGLRIIDLSSLPGTCVHKDTVIAGMITGHTLMVNGDRLYVFGANIDNGGASVFSLTDPWNPTYIGGYSTAYVHDAYVRGDTCYMGEIYDGFMTMVDMRNVANPVILGSVTTPDQFTHNSWLNDAGNICFTTDEVDGAFVAAYDVSNPSSITEVGRYRSSLSNGTAPPHNVKVLDDFLVTAYYMDGVNIADASRPHNMVEVGYYDTNPGSGGGFDGNWGLECYLPSGIIVACDMSQGVWILQPTYQRACYLEGNVTDASNGNDLAGVSVRILSTPTTDLTDFAGDYATGVADSGSYQVQFAKYGYRDTTVSVTLDNGVLTLVNIALTPNAQVQLTVNVVEAGTGNPIPNAGVIMMEVANQVKTAFTTDANGQIVSPSFMASDYELIAGQWGYVTASMPANVNAPTNTFTIALDKGYYDDFAFDFGWTVSGTAAEGDWVKDKPLATPFYTISTNPDLDVQGDYSDECFVTGNLGGDPFDDDVDQGKTTLHSPVMDLSGYTNPWLIFDYWFLTVTNTGGTGFKDSLQIHVSNGTDMQRVWFKRDLQQPVWVTDTVQLASFITVTNQMQLHISCSDILFDQIIEAGIDRVRIEDQSFVGNEGDLAGRATCTVYPNPSRGSSWVRYDLGVHAQGNMRLLDLDGRELRRLDLGGAQGMVAIDDALPAGMYFVVIEADGRRLATTKLLRLQ